MADFTQIIQEINDDITTNGVGAITGAKLNEVLRDMIAAVNAEKQDPLTIDATPTEGSTNPVQSGGVYVALQQKPTIFFTPDIMNVPPTILNKVKVGDVIQYGDDAVTETTVAGKDEQSDIIILVYNDGMNIGGFQYQNGVCIDAISFGLTDMANRVSGATNGNLAGLAANGDLTDSGKSPSDFATAAQGGKADTAVQPSDLATVATSGSYNDLLNKPTIPAAQVNSDWNANSGVAQILNKPTIPAAQVQSDWNEADNTKVDYIKNKPTIPNVSGKADKVVGATSGDVATLDGNGNLTDSGLSVFDFFVMVEDASTPPASMLPNTVYQYGTLSGNTTFPPLATPTEPDIANVYCWTFTTPATAPTITWPAAITSWAGGSAPTINASKSYEVSVMDGFATIIEN